MINKPTGVVSATKDNKHQTVIDLLNIENPTELHIVGRLDFNTSGLLLLTNDGRWFRRLSSPKYKVTKLYRAVLEKPISMGLYSGFC